MKKKTIVARVISWQKARKKCNLRKYIHRARCSNNEYSHPYLKIKIRFIWINSEHNFGWMNFIPTIFAPIQHFYRVLYYRPKFQRLLQTEYKDENLFRMHLIFL